MTKPTNTAAFQKATGKSWEEWLEFLESINAKDLPHKEIAQKVYEHGAGDWWAQSVTVAYEQHIGRRQPGQRQNGKFEVSASKTVNGSMDDTLEKWLGIVKARKQFDGVAVAREPATSQSDKFRYWNCSLADGSRVSVTIYEKEPGKAVIGLGHINLASQEDADRWRAFWKSQLALLDK